MERMRLIRQKDAQDCGASCIAMILEYYGRKIPIARVRNWVKVDKQGANIFGLLEAAKTNGISGSAYNGDADSVWDALTKNEIKVPAIIRIVNQYGYEHFVVIYQMQKNGLMVYDPGDGKVIYTKEQFVGLYQGQFITFTKDEDFSKTNERRRHSLKFWKIIVGQRWLLISTAILSFFVTIVGMAGAILFQYMLDNVLGNLNNKVLLEESLETMISMIFVLLILYVFKLAVQVFRGKLVSRMSKNMDIKLMFDYYDNVTELPMEFFDTRTTGEIMSRFNDTAKLRDALSGVTLTVMIDFVLLTFSGFILYKKSHVLFLIAGIVFIAYIGISAFYIKPLDKFNRRVMEQNAQFSSYMKETIDGMETVKLTQAEPLVKKKIHNLFNAFIDKNVEGSMMELKKNALIEFCTSLGTLFIICVGTFEVLDGCMSAGELIAFFSLLTYFLSPIENIVNLQGSIQTALVSAERLSDISETPIEDTVDGSFDEACDSLKLDHVSFRYGYRNLVLNDVSLSFEKGKQIAMVGPSGCGKSTVTKLIAGLYKPETGHVLINNKDIFTFSMKSIRDKIMFVPQETFLFSDSVLNNLLLSVSSREDKIPDDAYVEKILNMCCCDFIKRLPLGIHTILEENGSNLSGGQKQCIAIARALLKRPQILVLDEATSALDNITEYKILSAIKKEFPNMTIIMAAHRLSTVMGCDDIYVLQDGTIKESGTHKELILSDGIYSSMWKKQTGYI